MAAFLLISLVFGFTDEMNAKPGDILFVVALWVGTACVGAGFYHSESNTAKGLRERIEKDVEVQREDQIKLQRNLDKERNETETRYSELELEFANERTAKLYLEVAHEYERDRRIDQLREFRDARVEIAELKEEIKISERSELESDIRYCQQEITILKREMDQLNRFGTEDEYRSIEERIAEQERDLESNIRIMALDIQDYQKEISYLEREIVLERSGLTVDLAAEDNIRFAQERIADLEEKIERCKRAIAFYSNHP
jgi:chromosome segregation ATPase